MIKSNNHSWLPRKTECMLLLVVGVAIFFFSFPVRQIMRASSIVLYFNVFFVLGGGFLFLTYVMEKRIRPLVICLVFVFASLAHISNVAGERNLFSQLISLINISMPLLWIGLNVDKEVIDPVTRGFIRVINAMIILMVCIGIPDMVSGGMLQDFLNNNIFDSETRLIVQSIRSEGVYRFLFIFGHPLTMAWYFLLFFVLNVLNNKYNDVLLPTPLVVLITLSGLLLCNSRSALVIGTVMILLLNGDYKRRWIYLTATVLMIVAIAFVPIVNSNVAERIIERMQSESVSGGRNEAVLFVLEGYADPPGTLVGLGVSGSREVAVEQIGFIHNFEYPIMMYAYDVSIVGMVILYTIIFIIPLTAFIKERRWLECGLFLGLSCYINGFNLITDTADGMAQFCFIVLLLIYIGRETFDNPISSSSIMLATRKELK